MGHIELARWADVVLAAPATANLMARLAHGLADDLLTTLCLATAAPVVLAPAMNQQMWRAAATRDNRDLLVGRGVPHHRTRRRLAGVRGRRAGADERARGHRVRAPCRGRGIRHSAHRVPRPRYRRSHTGGNRPGSLHQQPQLRQDGICGGRRSPRARRGGRPRIRTGIDRPSPGSRRRPRRGRPRRCAAKYFRARRGATSSSPPRRSRTTPRPPPPPERSRRKRPPCGSISRPTPDILAEVAALDDPPFTVGFAAETEDLERHARSKLERKRLDLIAGNRVGGSDLGFDSDRNALLVLCADGGRIDLPAGPKTLLARQLLALVSERFLAKRSASHP